MSINIFKIREETSRKKFPVILREDESEISLKKAFLLSILAHPVILGLIWLVVKLVIFLMLIFGIHNLLTEKPIPEIKDIEFALVNPHKEIRIQRVKQQLKTQEGALKSKAKSPANQNKIVNRTPAKLSNKPHNETRIPLSKAPHKGVPPIKKNIPNVFSIPMPKIKPLSSNMGFGVEGPVGYSSPNSSPVVIPTSGEGAGGSGESNAVGRGKKRGNGGYSYGSGNAGAPKVGSSGQSYNDELKDVDLSPYVTELQRRIRRNWTPPKGNENKKVELFLRIAKDGRLLVLNIKRTSGNPGADNAATNAVKQVQPFRSLPSDYKGNYADIVFTFDYNVNSRY